MLKEQIAELEREFGLDEPLPQEDEGIWTIPLDDSEVTVTDLEPGVYFYTPLGELPGGAKEELMMLLTSANLFGFATDGAVIGIDQSGKNVTLSLAITEDIDFERFRNHVEDFINQKLFWEEKVSTWSE